jgi:hypothetical protein
MGKELCTSKISHSLMVHVEVTRGNFRESKQHGKGLFRDKNGAYFEEEWEKGELITRKEANESVNLDVENPLT